MALRNLMLSDSGSEQKWNITFNSETSAPDVNLSDRTLALPCEQKKKSSFTIIPNLFLLDFGNSFLSNTSPVCSWYSSLTYSQFLLQSPYSIQPPSNLFFIFNPNQSLPPKNPDIFSLGLLLLQLSSPILNYEILDSSSLAKLFTRLPPQKLDKVTTEGSALALLFSGQLHPYFAHKFSNPNLDLTKKLTGKLLQQFKKFWTCVLGGNGSHGSQVFWQTLTGPLISRLAQYMSGPRNKDKTQQPEMIPHWITKSDLKTNVVVLPSRRCASLSPVGRFWLITHYESYVSLLKQMWEIVLSEDIPYVKDWTIEWNLSSKFWEYLAQCLSWADEDTNQTWLLTHPFIHT